MSVVYLLWHYYYDGLLCLSAGCGIHGGSYFTCMTILILCSIRRSVCAGGTKQRALVGLSNLAANHHLSQ